MLHYKTFDRTQSILIGKLKDKRSYFTKLISQTVRCSKMSNFFLIGHDKDICFDLSCKKITMK